MDFLKMLAYVKETLEKNDAIKSTKPYQNFRSRYEHTRRVYLWAQRIMDDFPNCNKDVLLTSAIFHDIGYSCGKPNHALNGAILFKEYANANNFDEAFTADVSYNISMHSNKELLNNPNTSPELILLLEADLLDEEGCLGIVWDIMANGLKAVDSYEKCYDDMLIHSAHILSQDYMVTPKAMVIWEEKKEFVRNFIAEYKKDLFLGE